MAKVTPTCPFTWSRKSLPYVVISVENEDALVRTTPVVAFEKENKITFTYAIENDTHKMVAV